MSDYNFLMETRLSPEQYAVITLMSRLAAAQGLNLYLAGGAVRDLTYGQQVVRDLDFIVEGQPQRILRAIPESEKFARPAGPSADSPLTLDYQDFSEHFNSAGLIFSNGVRAELAMCREEIYSRLGQRPEVRPATVFEDLKRRDFAINALAVSLHPNSRGLLLDPTNGAGDIERREIRALQSHGFSDDPSRLYRLLRLGIRLDFKPDERTQRWFDAALAENAWQRLDSEQQSRELAAILREEQPGPILKMLAERGLLGGLDEKLATQHLAYDRFARIHNVLQSAPGADPFLLNFHCLVEKLPAEHKARMAKRVIGDARTIKLALSLEPDAKKLERLLAGAKASQPSQVYNLLSPQPQALLFYLLVNSKDQKVQNRIKSFLFKFPQIRSSLPRGELQSLGVTPGPEFDRILDKVFALQLDGKIKSHQQLMKEMRQLAGIKEPPPPPPPKKGKEGATPAAGGRKGKEAASPKGKHAADAKAAVATATTAPALAGKMGKTAPPASSTKGAAAVGAKPAPPAKSAHPASEQPVQSAAGTKPAATASKSAAAKLKPGPAKSTPPAAAKSAKPGTVAVLAASKSAAKLVAPAKSAPAKPVAAPRPTASPRSAIPAIKRNQKR